MNGFDCGLWWVCRVAEGDAAGLGRWLSTFDCFILVLVVIFISELVGGKVINGGRMSVELGC